MFISILIFLLITSPVYASIEGRLTGFSSDVEGNVLVEADYFDDGMKIQNDRIAYSIKTLRGLNRSQRRLLFRRDIKGRTLQIIQAKYLELNDHPLRERQLSLLPSYISNLNSDLTFYKNIVESSQEKTLEVDIDQDGNCEEEWDIREDGTRTVRSITPVFCP